MRMHYGDYWGGGHQVDKDLSCNSLFEDCSKLPSFNLSKDEHSSKWTYIPSPSECTTPVGVPIEPSGEYIFVEATVTIARSSDLLPAMAWTKKSTRAKTSSDPREVGVITRRKVFDDHETGSPDEEIMDEIIKIFEKWAKNKVKNNFAKDDTKDPVDTSSPVTLKAKEFALRVIEKAPTQHYLTPQTPFVAPPCSLSDVQFQHLEEMTVNDKD
uniref:Uncharacterized protein n=1 Tax=Cannabis sativa TaxID=3483 RepID=A0A803QJM5_CANSA